MDSPSLSPDYEGRGTSGEPSGSDAGASPSIPPFAPPQGGGDEEDTRCPPQQENLTSVMSGVLPWTDPDQRCGQQWTWLLDLPRSHGVGLQFHDVQLTQGRRLEVLSLSDVSLQWRVERTFLENDYSSSLSFPTASINLSPLLVNSSRVKIVVSPSRRPGAAEPASFFNLTYSALTKRSMPRKVESSGPSLSMYDCGRGPIPEVLRCNMVQECEYGEDEEACEYRVDGCDVGWVPYGRQCLLADFNTKVCDCDPIPGGQGASLPDIADMLCGVWFGAQLAILPDQHGLDLVVSAVRQSGFRSVALNIRKFRATNRKLHFLYRHVWQWGGRGGPMAYDQQELENVGPEHLCAMLDIYPHPRFIPTDCSRYVPNNLVFPDGFVCMRANPRRAELPTIHPSPERVVFARTWNFLDRYKQGIIDGVQVKDCSDGSIVHVFDRCLWGDHVTGAEWSPNNFPLFNCRFGLQVHYTLVCDGKGDCADGSDEDNCAPPRFELPIESSNVLTLLCDNYQVVDNSHSRCDGMPDCFDGSDEDGCSSCSAGSVLCQGSGCVSIHIGARFPSCPQIKEKPVPAIPVPGVVRLDDHNLGMSRVDPIAQNKTQFLFECYSGFYIPSHLLGNGEKDCPDGRDETTAAENIVCPGYYRCQTYGMCLHPDQVCDRVYDCPNKDDELYCMYSECPVSCTCEGFAIACRHMPFPGDVYKTRYLDLSGAVGVSFEYFHLMELLQFLNLSHCDLYSVSLSQMPRLKILDLSFNKLFTLASLVLTDMVGLTYLDLSSNPIVSTLDSTFSDFIANSGMARNLETLIFRNTRLQTAKDMPFQSLSQLTSLDIRGNLLDNYDVALLAGLSRLAVLYTDDPKLCCSHFHPTLLAECHAPTDELSSCRDLLRTNFFLVSLWLMAVLAIVGNGGVIVFRVFAKDKESPVFRILVINLCAADLLLGMYMVIIGSADIHFRDVYVSVEKEWRTGAFCTVAGYLAFVSSEMSTFVICLITLDRLLVVCFPLRQRLHLGVNHSAVACAALWLLAATLAAVPLLSDMQFYDLNAVCLPLPITRLQFSGQDYAFGIFIVLNFFLFILIGLGQLVIYRAIRQAGTAAGTQRRDNDMSIARRLFLVVFSDFCCWFPIGATGLLAYNGVPISGEVNVWAAIFILPINSALNPFLYTLNGALERRRKQRLEEKTKRMIGNLQMEIPKWKPSMVEETARICIKTKHVTREKFDLWLGLTGTETSSPSSEGDAKRPTHVATNVV